MTAQRPILTASRALSRRERTFAELVASGTSQHLAYASAGYHPTKSASARACASRLASRPDVAAYIAKLRAAHHRANALSLEETRSYLADAVRTPIGQLSPDSPLCQEHTESIDSDGNITRKIKGVSKLQAIELDAKLAGHFYADRQGLSSNPFGMLIVMPLQTTGNGDNQSKPAEAIEI